MEIREIAAAFNVSGSTINREWRLARVKLFALLHMDTVSPAHGG
jgi:IS30 family transposase